MSNRLVLRIRASTVCGGMNLRIGGQVRIFGYAPIIPLRYGARFLTGLTYNTAKVPIIVTNGIGTSNKNIRIGAPSEVVVITLHRLE